jgi:glycosyltransferase involved in cell wall biosynthesis
LAETFIVGSETLWAHAFGGLPEDWGHLVKELKKLDLVLFFTRGVSLCTWDQVGMFEREVALYRRLQEHGVQVTFVTYGDASDLAYARRLLGVRILCNRWGLAQARYERWLPWLHGPWLWRADIIKTNQTNGADVALRAARLWRKPLIARCGYMWSDLAARGGPERLAEAEQARRIESLVFNASDKVVVTTPAMFDYTVQQYQLPLNKVRVIPNYVLTELFSPNGTNPVPNRLCFIGRLSSEKNPCALVEACTGLDTELVMVGDGPLRTTIIEMANRLVINVKLLGNQPHAKLPEILRQSAIFLLVSPHEGQPKTLLEAMACGLPVIGADAPGIRELIRHGETGWLCGTDPESIRAAITGLLARPELCAQLGRNAHQFVVEKFGLDRIVELELALLREVFTG